jgi:hypothetical protein
MYMYIIKRRNKKYIIIYSIVNMIKKSIVFNSWELAISIRMTYSTRLRLVVANFILMEMANFLTRWIIYYFTTSLRRRHYWLSNRPQK